MSTKFSKSSICLIFSVLTASALLVSSCGGGGGGGSDYKPAAEVDVYVQPHTIDAGDRSLVTTDVWDVHPDGILLKLRYPLGLAYVKNSGTFEINGEKVAKSPRITKSNTDYVYLVYFFAQSEFGDDGRDKGTIRFEIQATKEDIDGLVEVDPIIREPGVPDDRQFDIANPLFGAKDEDQIRVRSSQTEATPTPSS